PRLAHRRDHRPPRSRLIRPHPKPAYQRPSPAHEKSVGFRPVAGLGVDPFAGAAMAVQQLRGDAQHSRFGEMPPTTRVALVQGAMGPCLYAYWGPECENAIRQ